MKNTINILTISMLMAGAVFAQENSASVADILRELQPSESGSAPAVSTTAPDVQAAVIEAPAPVAEVPVKAVPADETVAVDAPAALPGQDQSQPSDAVSPGNTVQTAENDDAFAGLAPKKKATLYKRAALERDHRRIETAAMDAVSAAWSTDLVLRSYLLAGNASERMKLKDGVTSSLDTATLFPHVEFPKGASATYQPKTGKLFVRNTKENLAMIETMLRTMGVVEGADASAAQIEIEAKFIEVSEGTLEALGFQWDIDDASGFEVGGARVDDEGAAGVFGSALRGSRYTKSLPFSRASGISSAAPGAWSTYDMANNFNTNPDELKLESTIGNHNLDLFITALDQSSGTDVLSAPRILTRDGEEATLRVGELHNYPEVFEGNTTQNTMLSVVYKEFNEKLLGVELKVTPRVTDDRNIELALNPRITEIAGWRQYQLAPTNSIYTYRQAVVGMSYIHEAVIASLPIFKKREINTEVVIANGGTIGMGGLINEKVESYEDSVPVLGHLPLIGRLFRTEGERAIKRNLLMFVTANIVEPNGSINTSRSFE